MSQSELETLLETEGVNAEGIDDLVSWARDRADALLESASDDTELGPLLVAGGTAGDEVVVASGSAGAVPVSTEDAGLEEPRVEQTAEPNDQDVTQPRAQMPQPEAPEPAPLPPIPVVAKSDDAEEIEEIEELDVEELELLDEEEEDGDEGGSSDAAATPDGGQTYEDSVAGPMPSLTDGPIRPDGERIPEDSSAGRLPEAPLPEAMPAEAMQPEEGAAVVSVPEPEPGPETESSEPPGDAPTFGPPDGTESVPAWKAALFSAQTGDDGLAAQKVQEESTATRLPTAPEERDEPSVATRLVAEEDEISQHSVDLSDLDLDD